MPRNYLKPKPVHKAKHMSDDGKVSPLCAARPRAINLRAATWTIRPEAVTCPRCLKAMEAGRAEP